MRASPAVLLPLERLPEADAALVRRAAAVLEANWTGRATRPSPRLYPHQWSWDSACSALGYARWDQDRAETELRSLFAGQWSNGLLPHIVFSEGGDYFPGPEFWRTEISPDAPSQPRTSGIVQPPLHATAAWRIYLHASDRARATVFLSELMPGLVAWHEYLYRERADERGVVEIWHPWESGMDNSPAWDDALERIRLQPGDVPSYRRMDVKVVEASERPSDAHYDRYAYLVGLFRKLRYRPDRIRAASPFALQPVLFNAILVQGNRDLAGIARVLGMDPQPFEAWAERTAAGVEAALWDDERGLYLDRDVRTGKPVSVPTGAAFAPLFAGVPAPERAERIVTAVSGCGVKAGDDGWLLTSVPPGEPTFQPELYWRGPVWPILNWILYEGLSRYGVSALAARVRTGIVELVRDGGFWEHYSPATRRGHGGEQFSWTAALVLDLLLETPGEERILALGGHKTEGRST